MNIKSFIVCFAAIVAAIATSQINFSQASSVHNTTLTWYGHSAFRVVTPQGKVLFIDPWLMNPLNPDAKNGVDQAVAAVGKVDYILVTHGHFDHVSDAVSLAKKTHAKLVTNFELGAAMVKYLGYPKDQAQMDTLGNMGGKISTPDGEVEINFVPAVHSSGLDTGSKDTDTTVYGGNPMGFVIEIKDGPTIYHMGDTAYFSDMELIGKTFHPDVALINIGGHFGMEPPQAALAAQAVKAKLVIPHHYKTFPILTQDAAPFFKLLDQKKIGHLEMKPGQTVMFEGKELKK
jgi:L-ascorbate metabolism protein UlaG (beta-lactamase superfamily)